MSINVKLCTWVITHSQKRLSFWHLNVILPHLFIVALAATAKHRELLKRSVIEEYMIELLHCAALYLWNLFISSDSRKDSLSWKKTAGCFLLCRRRGKDRKCAGKRKHGAQELKWAGGVRGGQKLLISVASVRFSCLSTSCLQKTKKTIILVGWETWTCKQTKIDVCFVYSE